MLTAAPTVWWRRSSLAFACLSTGVAGTNPIASGLFSQLNSKHNDGYCRIVDWWSFGIITYELMTGTTPFCHR